VRERGDLDPEATATMTLRELEAWLALEIVGVYHARVHRSLGAPPNSVWAAAIAPAPAPARTPTDPRRFLIDFLPAERRVLQRDGLHLFNIRYWSDELRRLMGQGEKVTANTTLAISRGSSRESRMAMSRLGRPTSPAPRSRSGNIAPRWPSCARPGVGRSTKT
jgi:hypothetical protein